MNQKHMENLRPAKQRLRLLRTELADGNFPGGPYSRQ